MRGKVRRNTCLRLCRSCCSQQSRLPESHRWGVGVCVRACVRAHGQAWRFPSISNKRRSSRKYNKEKHPDYLMCNLKCLKDGKMSRNGRHSAREGQKALMLWWKLDVNFLRKFQPASCFVSRSRCSSISDILLSQAAAFFCFIIQCSTAQSLSSPCRLPHLTSFSSLSSFLFHFRRRCWAVIIESQTSAKLHSG